MVTRIVLCYPVTQACLDQIHQAAGDYEVVNAGQERIDELLPTADIFIGHAKVPVDWDRALAAGRLKWIQSSAAGLDHCLVPGVIDSEIIVCSASGLFAPQVAEQTFALMMGLLRRIRLFTEATARRDFTRQSTDDLRGKTVGIVGLGGNGRFLASVLAPWDVRVIATDFFTVDVPAEVSQLLPADQLAELLAQSDIVVLTLPLNDSTRLLFDAEMIAHMKPGSYLINVARGGIVSEAALVAALDSGQLAGAGLDVTEVEPLSPESQLWDRTNVLITPHVGAQSARRVSDTTTLVCENLRRYRRGLALWNVVDKRLGFPHPSVIWRPGEHVAPGGEEVAVFPTSPP
jgi:phosphoglycerate dehydrogenase-like enzyme